MRNGRVTRDSQRRVVNVYRYIDPHNKEMGGYDLIKVEYADETRTIKRVVCFDKYEIVLQEDGSYLEQLLPDVQQSGFDSGVVSELKLNQRNGTLSYKKKNRYDQLVDQELSLKDYEDQKQAGANALLLLVLILFGGPVGIVVAGLWAVALYVKSVRQRIAEAFESLLDKLFSAYD